MLTQKAPDKQRVRYTTEWMREPVPCSVVGATTETESTLVLLSSQLSSLKLHKKEGSPDLVVERREGQAGEGREGGRRVAGAKVARRVARTERRRCWTWLLGGRQPRKQKRTYLKLVALRSHGSGISPPIRLSRRGPFYCPLSFFLLSSLRFLRRLIRDIYCECSASL